MVRGPSAGPSVVGEAVVDEVGAADGAVQQAPAAEEETGLPSGTRQERLVMASVPGGCDDRDLERADGYDIAVAHRDALEVHPLVGGQQVVGVVSSGQPQCARYIVVVDVSVRDRPDVDTLRVCCLLDRGEVAWGIDDQGRVPVVDEVAAVAQSGRLDDDDLHGILHT